mgnify:FL=1
MCAMLAFLKITGQKANILTDPVCRNLSMLAFCSRIRRTGNSFPQNCYLKSLRQFKKPTSQKNPEIFDMIRHGLLAFSVAGEEKGNSPGLAP